jgi:hypothetical protein
LFVGENGTSHIVKCRVCIEVKGKNKILATKWDSLCKHAIHQKVVGNMGFDVKKGDWFYSNVCKHAKNQITLTSRSWKTIDAQLACGMVGEKTSKVVLFSIVLHFL